MPPYLDVWHITLMEKSEPFSRFQKTKMNRSNGLLSSFAAILKPKNIYLLVINSLIIILWRKMIIDTAWFAEWILSLLFYPPPNRPPMFLNRNVNDWITNSKKATDYESITARWTSNVQADGHNRKPGRQRWYMYKVIRRTIHFFEQKWSCQNFQTRD